MRELVITVTMDDESDFDWLRSKCVPAVEDAVEQAKDEGRLDSMHESVLVSWDDVLVD